MCRTQQSAYASSTFKNFLTMWKAYFIFCIYFGFMILPASISNLCLFAQFLSRSFKSADSIASYISGIKQLHLRLQLDITVFEHFDLTLVLRGLSRIKQYKPRQASPVTLHILSAIYYTSIDLAIPSHKVFWSLFLIAFFTMGRKSQFVVDTALEITEKIVRRKHILITGEKMFITFISSKTNQFGQRHHTIPLLSIPGSIFCPVTNYRSMIETLPCGPDEPAFMMPQQDSLVPLSYSNFQKFFKNCITSIGLPASKFSSHSFRRGGCSLAFHLQALTELIQFTGDWKSDCYKKYLHLQESDKLIISKLVLQYITNNNDFR